MIYEVYRSYESKPGIVDFLGEIEAENMDDAENQVENHFTLEPGEEFDIQAKDCREEEIARLKEVIEGKDAAINMLRESVRMAAENLKITEEEIEEIKSLNENLDIENDTLLLWCGNHEDKIKRLTAELAESRAANQTIKQRSKVYSAALTDSAKLVKELGERLNDKQRELNYSNELFLMIGEALEVTEDADPETLLREITNLKTLEVSLADLRAFVEKWREKKLVRQEGVLVDMLKKAAQKAATDTEEELIYYAATIIEEYDAFASEAWTIICRMVEGNHD